MFFDLAKKNGRNTWGTSVAGVCAFFGVIIITVFSLVLGFGALQFINTHIIDIIGIASGAFGAYILYQFLKSKWEKESINKDYELLDDDLTL